MPPVKHNQLMIQLREMSVEELEEEIKNQRAALYDLKRRNAMKQLDNTSAIRKAHRQIARALTIIRERELAAQAAAGQV
jgi:large subunit ribosomal protein L29